MPSGHDRGELSQGLDVIVLRVGTSTVDDRDSPAESAESAGDLPGKRDLRRAGRPAAALGRIGV
jgi:hypothetical protein